MSKTPCLWFDGQAEEAANFYVSVFPDSRLDEVMRSRRLHRGP
jgi:predicted 3-demethylubiquinone-9 3-methyltransferase (glyoxalase superfamily)